MRVLIAAAMAALLATPAFAGGLVPDGTYQCAMDDHPQGQMVILGNTYQGPNYDGQYDGRYTFDADPSGNITWHGPLGIYADPSIRVIGSMAVANDDGTVSIAIHLTMDGQNIHVADCDPV